MAFKLVTAPTMEPLTLDEIRLHLRIDDPDENSVLNIYRTAARQDVEHILRRALCTQTWDLYLHGWPVGNVIEIPLPPLQNVTSVKYYDDDNTEATFASTNYMVDIATEPGRIVLLDDASWPTTDLRPANGVIIRFVAGYGTADDVPYPIKQAMLLITGHYYENREASVVGKIVTMLPQAVDALLWPYRVFKF